MTERMRATPQFLEGEQSFLGAVLISPETMGQAVELLGKQEFYRESHREIWDAMLAVWGRGDRIDLVSLTMELRARGTEELAGGAEYLSALIYECPGAVNIAAYARPVRQAAELREIAVAADSVLTDAYAPGADSDELLGRLEGVVLALQARRNTVQVRTAADVLGELAARFQKRREGVAPGIPTGFVDLDKKIGGLQPGEITTTAARPGMGKSAKVANEIEHIARIQPYPVAIFSLEMDAESLMERMVCGQARVDGRNLKRGTLADWEWDAVAAAVERLADLNVLIFDATEMTAMQMRAKVRGIVAQHGGIGAFAVDYLQIVDDEDRRSTRQEVIRRHMQTFRRMAKENHCPGMILAQLNRECEKRENKRPMLSDLAEAGAIEQESHVVQFIYREAYYLKQQEEAMQVPGEPRFQSDAYEDNTAEIIIAKNRNGPTGTVKLAFVPEFARFENLA